MGRMKATKSVGLGERLRRERERNGLSLLDAMTEVRRLLPRPLWVTHETLRRYEKGLVPEEKADPVLLEALAIAYGVRLEELSPAADAAFERLIDLRGGDALDPLVGPGGGRNKGSDLRSRTSTCIPVRRVAA